MNPLILTLTVTAFLALLANPLAARQADDALPVAPAKPDPAEDQAKGQQRLLNEIQDQQAQFEKSAADFEKHRVDMEKHLAEQGAKAAALNAQKKYIDRVQTVGRRPSGTSSRSLVIRSTEGDAKDLANLDEDLTIMSHIFNKALRENLGTGFDRKAMGIDVFFAPVASPIRSLYLEGYGALFFFSVNWPLVTSPADTEAGKEKAPADSTWDEAKHELYGSHNNGKSATAPGEEFSSEKMGKLQTTLFEAIKNAANIRNLKPDEAITLCVFGTPAHGPSVKAKAKAKERENDNDLAVEEDKPKKAFAFDTNGGRGTTMTIRVKKADTDAYATGKLTLEQFRAKATIATYVGNPMSGSPGFSFANGVFGGGGGVGGGDSFSIGGFGGNFGATGGAEW